MKHLSAKFAHLKADLGAKGVDELPQLSMKRQASSAWQRQVTSKAFASLMYSARSQLCLEDCVGRRCHLFAVVCCTHSALLWVAVMSHACCARAGVLYTAAPGTG